jgi:putative oxidoreductase
VLLGATWVHSGNGWLFTAPNGGWEYPAFLTLAAVVVGLIGAGRYVIGARQSPSRSAHVRVSQTA